MLRFSNFIAKKEKTDVQKTISKLPIAHQKMLKKYSLKFEDGNTLKKDSNSAGEITQNTITISSPWNYGREWALLHEIGHLVWDNYVKSQQKNKWKSIVKKTKNKSNQNAEELFCHAYAATYAKNKIEKHHHPEWVKFVRWISNSPSS